MFPAEHGTHPNGMSDGTASAGTNKTLEPAALTGPFLGAVLWGVGLGKLVNVAGLERALLSVLPGV